MGFLVVAALLGLVPAFIAQSKGRSFAGWWIYGFLLFIVAIIHVLIIPSEIKSNIHSPAIADLRDCPYCAEPIRRQASKCKHCGSDVDPLPILLSTIHSDDGDGTKIHWKRLLVLLLAVIATYIIVTFGGAVIR
ncbi:TPA: zinc ribbon domain-containing protein [Serratia marcescens]